MADDCSSLSKKQRRKQAKAQWLVERKAAEVADGASVVKRKRRNQRQSRANVSTAVVPTVDYQRCTCLTCDNYKVDSNCIIRRIAPYVHCFALFIKCRWSGYSLREVFVREFPTLSTAYCARAVQLGLVRVNGSNIDLDFVFKSGDYLEHYTHRHEPDLHLPVKDSNKEVTTLFTTWIHFENDEVIVVNKPSGVPVHPSGNFQFNTLAHILQHDRRTVVGHTMDTTFDLFPVHRLDRLTSGLLLLAKTADKARSLTAEFTLHSAMDSDASRSIQKYYVARVKGEFPDDKDGFAHVQGLQSGLVKIDLMSDKFWRVTAPIGLKCPRDGHVRCVTKAADSKSCVTLMRRRGEVVEGESIVECLLVTGRTHQIRVHQQHLGFPIGNDPLYGCMTNETCLVAPVVQTSATDVRMNDVSIETIKSAEDDKDREQRCIDACDICCYGDKQEAMETVATMEKEEIVLWLHSYRYVSRTWSFEVPLPLWAFIHHTKYKSNE